MVAELSVSEADVRWTRAMSMHVTLKFLGDVDARDLEAVDAALSRVAGAAQPTRCRLRDVGSFPHLRRPRVLWIGVQTEDKTLSRLHEMLETELGAIGFPREGRRFRPHVTLGRVRGSRGLSDLRSVIERHRDFDAGKLDIEEVTLFESELDPRGARYHSLGVYPLRARA